MTEGTTADLLRSFVQRIERLKEEQDAIAEDVREVYAEAKSMGFDKTALGQVVAIRRKRAKDAEKFEELSAIVELYMATVEGREAAHDEPPCVRTRMHVHEEGVDPATGEIRDTAPPDLKPAGPTVPPVNHAFSAGESPSTPVGEAVQASESGELEESSPRLAGKPAIRQDAAAAGDGRKASGEGEAPSPRRALAEIAAGYTPTKPPQAADEEPDIPAFLRRGDPECVVKEVRS